MHDFTKLFEVHKGMTVKIKVRNQSKNEIGKIVKILSGMDNPNGIEVAIDSGYVGNIIEIINSTEIIKERIFQTESHYSDNKEDFYDPDMRYDSIPKAIQAFANAEGGFLYIGVKDDAPPEEKIVGLDEDRKTLGELSEGKFQDKFRSDIEDVVEKHLRPAQKSVVSLLDFDFPEIDGKIILEITIKSSSEPIFFKYFTRKNNEMVFPIKINDKIKNRKLDEFWYRAGSRKRETATFEEFFQYFKEHFIKT
ncbi:MAG: ATP-binding protein [Candidatus Nitrosopelagicus sp.]|nr:ATP-binding protein [Candidatus Nitrosopelagicus sp.]